LRQIHSIEANIVSGGEGDDNGAGTACSILGALGGIATGALVTGLAGMASVLTLGTTLPGAGILGAVTGAAAGAGIRAACIAALDDDGDDGDDD
jgi:hypothetical protein